MPAISPRFGSHASSPTYAVLLDFLIGHGFFAANAMVFGSVASASSWEPFRRAITAIAVVCFLRPWLVEKHKDLLDVIRWAPLPGPDIQFAQAKSCSKNKGILDGGNRKQAEISMNASHISSFRFPRIVADLCGAFGFLIGPWFFVANVMVFGSVFRPAS